MVAKHKGGGKMGRAKQRKACIILEFGKIHEHAFHINLTVIQLFVQLLVYNVRVGKVCKCADVSQHGSASWFNSKILITL